MMECYSLLVETMHSGIRKTWNSLDCVILRSHLTSVSLGFLLFKRKSTTKVDSTEVLGN